MRKSELQNLIAALSQGQKRYIRQFFPAGNVHLLALYDLLLSNPRASTAELAQVLPPGARVSDWKARLMDTLLELLVQMRRTDPRMRTLQRVEFIEVLIENQQFDAAANLLAKHYRELNENPLVPAEIMLNQRAFYLQTLEHPITDLQAKLQAVEALEQKQMHLTQALALTNQVWMGLYKSYVYLQAYNLGQVSRVQLDAVLAEMANYRPEEMPTPASLLNLLTFHFYVQRYLGENFPGARKSMEAILEQCFVPAFFNRFALDCVRAISNYFYILVSNHDCASLLGAYHKYRQHPQLVALAEKQPGVYQEWQLALLEVRLTLLRVAHLSTPPANPQALQTLLAEWEQFGGDPGARYNLFRPGNRILHAMAWLEAGQPAKALPILVELADLRLRDDSRPQNGYVDLLRLCAIAGLNDPDLFGATLRSAENRMRAKESHWADAQVRILEAMKPWWRAGMPRQANQPSWLLLQSAIAQATADAHVLLPEITLRFWAGLPVAAQLNGG